MITNMANLALVDKAATPVTHQFTPTPTATDTARWSDREHNGGIAIGYATVTFRVKEPVAGNGIYRQTVDFTFPKVDMALPNKPTLVGLARAKVEFVFPDVLSDQERKDIVQQVYTCLSQGSASTLGDNIAIQSKPY